MSVTLIPYLLNPPVIIRNVSSGSPREGGHYKYRQGMCFLSPRGLKHDDVPTSTVSLTFNSFSMMETGPRFSDLVRMKTSPQWDKNDHNVDGL